MDSLYCCFLHCFYMLDEWWTMNNTVAEKNWTQWFRLQCDCVKDAKDDDNVCDKNICDLNNLNISTPFAVHMPFVCTEILWILLLNCIFLCVRAHNQDKSSTYFAFLTVDAHMMNIYSQETRPGLWDLVVMGYKKYCLTAWFGTKVIFVIDNLIGNIPFR